LFIDIPRNRFLIKTVESVLSS